MMNLQTPHRPWLAALMSLVLPGFGQLYNGQPNRAIWLFASFAFLCAPALALIALKLPDALVVPMLVLGLLLTLGLWLYAAQDAWQVACRTKTNDSHPWQVSGMYLAALVLGGLLTLPLVISYVRAHMVQAFRIPSGSMQPTLLAGDFVMADMRYNCPGCKHAVRHGDVAIFVYPNDRTQYYVKRIIGLPGDRVQLQGTEVILNGKTLTAKRTSNAADVEVTETFEGRSWQVRWSQMEDTKADSTFIVPSGQVLVLGDYRSATKDSRHFGSIPLQDVVGRVRQLWFSWGDAGVRWDRLGRLVD